MSVISVPDDGTIRVSLFDVNNQWIKNYRRDAFDDKLDSLVGSIDQATEKDGEKWKLGIKQPVLGCWNKDKSAVLLSAGFCRLEAGLQIALAKVIKEYNEKFEYKKGDEGFVHINGNPDPKKSPSTLDREAHRRAVRDQGGEWMAKYDAALKAHTLQINLRAYGDPDSEAAKRAALLDNLDENRNRTNPSLYDEMHRVVELKDMGYKGNEIAKTLDLSQSAVSHYAKVFNLPVEMREYFQGEKLDKEWPNPEERAHAVAAMETCLSEYVARLRFPKDDPKTIDFSKAREITYAVTPGKGGEPLVRMKDALGLLKILTRVHDDGKPSTVATPDLSVIMTAISSAKRLLKSGESTELPVAEKTPEQIAADVKATAEETAKLVAAAQATPATATTPPVQGSVPGVAVPAPVKTDVPVGAPATSTPNAALEAELMAANNAEGEPSTRLPVDVPPPDLEESLSLDDLIDSSDDMDAHLAEATEAVAASKEAMQATGEMKSKMTADVKVDPYAKRKAPEVVHRWISEDLKNVTRNEASTPVTAACTLAVSAALCDAIGLTEERNQANKASIDYIGELENYLAKLEEVAAAAATVEQKAELMALKPKFQLPKFVQ